MKRFSIGYAILKVWVRIGAELFYRKFTITGLEKFPRRNVPVVLAANHQNAMMDALMCCVSAPGQLTFLTRADIFKNPVAYLILTHLNMLPIYRQHDKVDQIALNEEIFKKCFDRLKAGSTISLFPEGNHNNKKFLRPMRKGLARVAFGAEESGNFELDLQIVPVGMDYSNYTDFRSDLLVMYGKPISLKPYLDLYKSEPGRAYSQLMNDVKARLSELVIDIRDKENYTLIRKLEPLVVSENVLKRGRLRHTDRWQAYKTFTEKWNANFQKDPKKIDELDKVFREYEHLLKTAGFSVADIESDRMKPGAAIFMMLGLILTLPLFLIGFIFNAIPAFFVKSYVKKSVRDIHFKSSIKLAFGVFIFPIFWILLALVGLSLFGSWNLSVLLLILAPLSGIIAVHWRHALKKLRLEMKLNRFRKHDQKKDSQLAELRRQILNLTESING